MYLNTDPSSPHRQNMLSSHKLGARSVLLMSTSSSEKYYVVSSESHNTSLRWQNKLFLTLLWYLALTPSVSSAAYLSQVDLPSITNFTSINLYIYSQMNTSDVYLKLNLEPQPRPPSSVPLPTSL